MRKAKQSDMAASDDVRDYYTKPKKIEEKQNTPIRLNSIKKLAPIATKESFLMLYNLQL